MNNFYSFLIKSGWLCMFLLGGVGIGSATYTIAQPVGDTTGVQQIPIDSKRSIILWKGTEMWQTGKHEGTVNLSEGYLSFENGQIIGGQFVADMNSIAITDIPKHEPIPRRNLRNHLKSDDFFYVEKYPTAEFKITKTEALKADSLKIWGDLSIRDVTKPISFTATKEEDKSSELVFNASFSIDRFEYNVSYQGSYWDRLTSIFDNNLVDADILLSIELVTSPIKQKELVNKPKEKK